MSAALPLRALDRSAFAHTEAALAHEWLVTNGLGGYACGTVALANTRRYHGLLIAALRPPVERMLMLAKLDLTVRYRGESFRLGCNEYQGGVLDPQGFRHLARFDLIGQAPRWTWALGDARLEQRIWMAAGRNTVYVGWTLVHAAEALEIEAIPLCAWRDYHAHQHGGAAYHVEPQGEACRIVAGEGARSLYLSVEGAEFRAAGDWYWRFQHREEAGRGLDAHEDLYCPGSFLVRLEPRQSAVFLASAEDGEPAIAPPRRALAHEMERQGALLEALDDGVPPWVRTLTLAADQYLVARHGNGGAGGDPRASGTTVIAGYPWFADWGRDTMIALPGLALATGRQAEAAAILRTFAAHASQGMLPNRFPDAGEAPEYNTVDATLWLFHALAAYLRSTGDRALLRETFPVLEEIVAWHLRGTRYGIGVDESDGLLRAGEPGVQLTWMDAKVGDWVVTPRTGKPVEINALWHYALAAMARWAAQLGLPRAGDYAERERRVAESFGPAFWNPEARCLYDVVDSPVGEPDAQGRRVERSVRPNQIFAVSLGTALLKSEQARAVVDCCARELLTPVGLRSLSPRDPAYVPRYEGGPRERDGAYHQGTVWSWLLGPFVLAHHRVYGDRDYACALLEQACLHLDEACVGQVSEIFDGEPPHAPRGCFAQAWGVAETLRAWHELRPAQASAAPSPRKTNRILATRRERP